MSRLEFLRVKRAASSYGQPLTFFEQLELERLEAELSDARLGYDGGLGAADIERRRSVRPAETFVYEG